MSPGKSGLSRRLVAYGTGGVFLIRSVAILFAYALHILLARLLGVTSFGDYSFALSVVNLGTMLAVFGLPQSAIRFVSDYRAPERGVILKRYLLWCVGVICAGSFLSGSVLVISRGYVESLVSEGSGAAVLAGASLIPAAAGLHFISAVLRGFQRAWAAASIEGVLPRVISIVLILGFLVLGGRSLDSSDAVWLTAAANALVVLVGIWVLAKGLPTSADGSASIPSSRTWLRSCIPLLLLSFFQMGMARTDILIVAGVLGPSAAGIYSAAERLSTLVGFAITSAIPVIAPVIAQFHVNGNRQDLQKLLVSTARLVALSTLGLFVGMSLFGGYGLLLYGEDFQVGYVPLLVLSGGQFIISLSVPSATVLAMTGYERDIAWTYGLAVILNVVLNFLLIPQLGMIGGSIATVTSVVLCNFTLVWRVVVRLRVDPTVCGFFKG